MNVRISAVILLYPVVLTSPTVKNTPPSRRSVLEMYHLPPVCPTLLTNAFSIVGDPKLSTAPRPAIILSL